MADIGEYIIRKSGWTTAGIAIAASLLLASCTPAPTAQRMKADLVGKTLGDVWRGPAVPISDPTTITSFTVHRTSQSSDIITYENSATINTRQGACTADIGMSYRRDGSGWELEGVSAPTVNCPNFRPWGSMG